MTGDDESKFTRKIFQSGDFLMKEGETGDEAYVIVSGKVEIRKGELGRSPTVLAVRGKGDVIGEMALFDDKPHMATAVATKKTVVNAMSKNEFRRRLKDMDPIMRGIVGMLVEKAREMADDLLKHGDGINWASWRQED